MLDRLVKMPTTRHLAITGVAVLAMLLMGYTALHTPIDHIFSVDTESNWRWPPWDSRPAFPALISAGFMLLAGWCWLEWFARAVGIWPKVVSAMFGCLLIFLAIDETFVLHEQLTGASGVRWQLVYVPIVGAVVVTTVSYLGYLAVVSKVWRPGALVVLGGALWVLALILEFAQFNWSTPVPGGTVELADAYMTYVFIEEVLELLGSACMLLAVLALARSQSADRVAIPSQVRTGV